MTSKGILKQVKNAIRNPVAWPGGYPIYTVMADGEILCADCARENYGLIVSATKDRDRSGWQAADAEILWEGEEFCSHCGKVCESAYGKVEDDENN